MDEINRILKLSVDDRTQADALYLKEHEAELTDEQKASLKEWNKIADGANENDTVEEYSFEFKKKSEKENGLVGTKVTRAFHTEVKDLGEGKMEAIISSQALDRHGEIIDMRGMNIKDYMNNPIVADGHNYDKPSVGRTLKLTKKADGKLIAVFEWAKDVSERANELYKLYKNGFQFAFSIGFMVDEMDGNTFTKSTMIEFSPVLIPANPEALLLAKQKGLDKVVSLQYNEFHMKYNLSEVIEKGVNDLTVGEIAFLKEKESELTEETKVKFASVLKEKEVKEVIKEVGIKAEEVAQIVSDSVEKAVSPLKLEIDEMKKADPVSMKNISTTPKAHLDENGEIKKEVKFLHYVRGLQIGNFKNYLDIVGKDAMNTTEDGDVLPPTEFAQEIERLEEQYGVARRFARLRNSSTGKGISFLFGADDVEIFDTAEGGAKQSSRNSYTTQTLLWRKFAGILPITDELTEDSAFDLWRDATNRFARAYARKEDELVFTETSGVSPKNVGILEVAGTNVVTMSGTGSDDNFADVVYDDLVDMLTGVPTASQANGRFYFHRTLLGVLMKMKDDQGKPIWLPSVAGGAPATILNKPYELVEVMPAVSESGPNTPFMAFGDLDYVTLAQRTNLNIKMFDSGSVGDPDEVDQEANQINLLTQDAQVMRAVKRMNAVVRFPSAFSVLKTGVVNS